jgi:hypothetical protein
VLVWRGMPRVLPAFMIAAGVNAKTSLGHSSMTVMLDRYGPSDQPPLLGNPEPN